MTYQELSQLTDDELLLKKKELKKSRMFHALAIGFLIGILIFGLVSWLQSSEKRIGFFIPMLIPIYFIYKLFKNPNKHKDLEAILKERNLW